MSLLVRVTLRCLSAALLLGANLWFAAAQQNAGSEALTGPLAALNGELSRATRTQAYDAARLRVVLDRRAELLRELMGSDPQAALALGLPDETLATLRRLAPAAPLEVSGTWEGLLEASVADDFEHGLARTLWHLRTADRRFDLHIASSIGRGAGNRVRVSGFELDGEIVAPAVTQVSAPLEAVSQAACTTTGPQNIAVLMVTTPSNPVFPTAVNNTSVTKGFFGDATVTSNTNSLNGFWKEMSDGQASAAGRVLGPLALGQDYSCAQYEQIFNAAVSAADGLLDFREYTRIAILFPVGSCATYAGLSSLGCRGFTSPSKGALNSSASWFPIVPGQSTVPVGLFAHELGHGLGLGHSSTQEFGASSLGPISTPGNLTEYGDPFSLMGYPYNGSGRTSGQYPAQHKSQILHWLAAGAGFQEVTSAGTYTIAPLESSGVRGLRVLRDAVPGDWLWLEYRQPIGDVDSALQYLSGSNAFQGALVHHEDPSLDSVTTYLLDMTPSATSSEFKDAALTPGHSWSDPYTPLTLTVNSATSASLSVSVNYDTPCAALQVSRTRFTVVGGSGTVSVTAPSSCAWTASTSANWITFSGSVSGQGNGTVPFSVAGNSGPQRSASIAIARQSTMVMQAGTGVTIWSVSPSQGTGSSGTFTFELTDDNGAADIGAVLLYFEPNGGCQILVYPGIGQVRLGSSYFYLDTPGGSAGDSFCTVSSTGSSIVRSPTQIFLTLAVSFPVTSAGTHRIEAEAYSAKAGWSPVVVPLGIWTVPSCTYAVSSATAAFGAAGGAGSVTVTAPAGCAWSASSTASWLTITSGFSGSGNGVVNFQVAANASGAARNAAVSVAGQSVAISQAAASSGPAGWIASQSSTLAGYSSAGAGSAIDGNSNGNFFSGSVTHTNSEANAWWQVDLGASATVGSVVIWNRTDCCGSRLTDYWVFVSNSPFAASDTPATLQFRAGTWSSHQTSAPNPSATIGTGAVAGRYIRVQLNGTGNLSLAEVQVSGSSQASSNVALGKPATQSSTLTGYATAGAGGAVDGNSTGSFFGGSVTHTNSEANPWWQVDLGTSTPVSSVIVWNRTDCCGSRLSDFWVFVSDTPFGASENPATLQFRAGTWSSHQTGAPNPSVTIATGGVAGRYVRLQLNGSDALSLAEVQVMGAAPAGSNNLAVGKIATQSSTLAGYGTAGAGSAVDGATNGSFFSGSVTHTNSDANAWWQVDLGVSATVNSVVVWNRTDCCGNRLNDYWVFVSDAPFAASDTPATLQFRSGTWSSHQVAAPNPSTAIATGGVTGRYVRVQLNGSDVLSLAEVQVMGASSPGANVALGKAAAQSTTLGGYATAGAGSANDGATNGNFFSGSVTHTNSEANAWWQVDLGTSTAITSVVIWNRTDCCASRLGDYWVFVSDAPFASADTPATLQFRAGTWSSHQTSAPNPQTSIATGAVSGRYVRVQLAGTSNLSLAEVQVFGP